MAWVWFVDVGFRGYWVACGHITNDWSSCQTVSIAT